MKQAPLALRIRLLEGKEIAIGPGKAELLQWVQETGSISEAARRMNMSYMRAWNLIQTMNGCFHSPVVATERGGHLRGGASLTATGSELLRLYLQMEAECQAATVPSREAIEKLRAKAG